MRVGPLLVLLWLLILLAGCAAPLVHWLRHRSSPGRRLARSFLAPLGGAMALLLIVLYVGLAENTWSWASPRTWLCLIVGAAGLPLTALGWRHALQPRLGPGDCPRCGYAKHRLDICPECGPSIGG